MFKQFNRFLSFGATALILGGLIVGAPLSAHAIAATLVQITNSAANPVPTESVDASNAFQTTVTINSLGVYSVPIPAGDRLVVGFVAIDGDSYSSIGPTQPKLVLESSINGGGFIQYYLSAPLLPTVPNEYGFVRAQPLKIYADTLNLGTSHYGAAPSNYNLTVTISGHLAAIP